MISNIWDLNTEWNPEYWQAMDLEHLGTNQTQQVPRFILSWSISLNVTYLWEVEQHPQHVPWISCYDRYTSPPQTVRKLCECCSPAPKKKNCAGWCTKFWDGLNRLQNSNELDHPLIWETTRNPCLASRLQCVCPYDPVRDRQVHWSTRTTEVRWNRRDAHWSARRRASLPETKGRTPNLTEGLSKGCRCMARS